MHLHLKTEMRRFIDEKIRKGQYANAEAVIHAALGHMMQQERGDFAPGELDALLAVGIAQLARGESIDGEQALRKRQQRRAGHTTAQ